MNPLLNHALADDRIHDHERIRAIADAHPIERRTPRRRVRIRRR